MLYKKQIAICYKSYWDDINAVCDEIALLVLNLALPV